MTLLRAAGALVAVLTATAVAAVLVVPHGTGRAQGEARVPDHSSSRKALP